VYLHSFFDYAINVFGQLRAQASLLPGQNLLNKRMYEWTMWLAVFFGVGQYVLAYILPTARFCISIPAINSLQQFIAIRRPFHRQEFTAGI
jgi:hypothetical protein